MIKYKYKVFLGNGNHLIVFASSLYNAIILGMAEAINKAYEPEIDKVLNLDTGDFYSDVYLDMEANEKPTMAKHMIDKEL